MLAAIRVNDFLRRANGSGQANGNHARPRTDPDDAERLTGIYGSVRRLGVRVLTRAQVKASFVKGGPGSSQAFSLLRDSHGVRDR
jgi:hypothetical protein